MTASATGSTTSASQLSSDFLLALMLFLGGAWYFLLLQIVDLSTKSPGEYRALYLAFIHYVIFIYLLGTLYSLALRSSHVPNEKLLLALLSTWPPILVAVLACLYFVRFPALTHLADTGFVLLFGFIFVVVQVWYWRHLKKLGVPMSGWGSRATAIFIVLGISGAFPLYMVAMSVLFADVAIHSDKDFYSPGSVAHIEIQASGYLFLPEIRKVEVFRTEYQANGGGNSYIFNLRVPTSIQTETLDANTYDRMLEITFRLQVPSVELKDYYQLRISSRDD